MTACMMWKMREKNKSYRKELLSHLAYSPDLKYALIFPMLEAYRKGITQLLLLAHVIVASYCIMNVPRLNDLNICF